MKINKTTTSITFEFNDGEMTILGDSLLDPLAWIETAVSEKLANCQNRLLGEWQTRLRADRRVEAIPTDDKALLDLILAQPDYKNRADRGTLILEQDKK